MGVVRPPRVLENLSKLTPCVPLTLLLNKSLSLATEDRIDLTRSVLLLQTVRRCLTKLLLQLWKARMALCVPLGETLSSRKDLCDTLKDDKQALC